MAEKSKSKKKTTKSSSSGSKKTTKTSEVHYVKHPHHPEADAKKHHKPYRKRHVSLLGASIIVLALMFLILGGQWVVDNVFNTQTSEPTKSEEVSVITNISSSYGFSVPVDLNEYIVTATEITSTGEASEIENSQLSDDRQLNLVVLKPKTSVASARDLGTNFYIDVATSPDEVSQVDGDFDNAVNYFALKSNNDFSIKAVSQKEEVIDGVKFQKTVYERTVVSPNTPSLIGTKTYAIQWAGIVEGNPLSFGINGLSTNSGIPQVYAPILRDLNFKGSEISYLDIFNQRFAGTSNVLGATNLNSELIADYASPAVVKIYYGICTDVSLDGEVILTDYCNGGTGSGFFVSSDGYVATNGHVVVVEPIDVMVEYLLSDIEVFKAFLGAAGISQPEIATILESTELVASQISALYDEYDKGTVGLEFSNKQEAINVALSDNPLPGSSDNFEAWTQKNDSDTVKSAELVGYSYSAGDSFRSIDGNESTGFSESDIALLKIDVDNTPYLDLLEESVSANQSITVVGFPGNAENELVKQDEIAITVTNGIISSVREAAGSTRTVYQSDVDVSAGNSGGPALTDTGDVLGLLTYRYRGDTVDDAAISYIRDVNDLRELIDNNDVVLVKEGSTQEAWEKGLQYYSESKLSKSIEEFNVVKESYPAHRLVDTYIANANTGISEGRDVQDFPVVILVTGILVGLIGVGVAVVLITRHRVHHHTYNQVEQANAAIPPGATTVNPPVPPASGQAPTNPVVGQPPASPTPSSDSDTPSSTVNPSEQ